MGRFPVTANDIDLHLIKSFLASIVNPHGVESASNKNPDYKFTEVDVLYTKLSYIATVLYYTIISTTKLSILLMYNRLFSASASFCRQVIIISVLVVLFWLGCTLADLLDCIPLKWTWLNSTADPRYCFNYNIFWFTSGIVEACLDLIIIAMPVSVVLGLQLSLAKKVAVTAEFLLGAL